MTDSACVYFVFSGFLRCCVILLHERGGEFWRRSEFHEDVGNRNRIISREPSHRNPKYMFAENEIFLPQVRNTLRGVRKKRGFPGNFIEIRHCLQLS